MTEPRYMRLARHLQQAVDELQPLQLRSLSMIDRLLADLQERWGLLQEEIQSQREDFTNNGGQQDSLFVDNIIQSYYAVRTQIHRRREDLELAEPTTTIAPPPPVHQLPNLGDYNIPSFEGNPSEWPCFWTSFEMLIGRREDIPSVLKLNHLLRYLKGAPYEAIKDFPIADDNYEPAIALLKARYAAPEDLKHSLMKELFRLPHPNHKLDQLTDFNEKFQTLEARYKRVNHGQGFDDTLATTVILDCLHKETKRHIFLTQRNARPSLEQIREGLKDLCELLKNCDDSEPSLTRGHIQDNMERRRPAPMNQARPANYQNHPSSHSNQNYFQGGRSGRSSHQPITFPPRACIFCNNNTHKTEGCRKYSHRETRRARAMELQLCMRCFGKNHTQQECLAQLHCRHCSGRHHTLQCMRAPPNPSTSINTIGSHSSNQASRPAITRNGNQNRQSTPHHYNQAVPPAHTPRNYGPTRPPRGPPRTAPTTWTPPPASWSRPQGTPGQPPMTWAPSQRIPGPSPTNWPPPQGTPSGTPTITHRPPTPTTWAQSVTGLHLFGSTAMATATLTFRGNPCLQKRVFLDTGAQHSFIHPSVVRALNLRPIRAEKMSLVSFTERTEPQYFDVVRVKLQAGTVRFTIPALVSSLVDKPLCIPGLTNVANELRNKGVTLADQHLTSDTLQDVAMIIGAAHFPLIVHQTKLIGDIHIFQGPAGAIIYGPLPPRAYDNLPSDLNGGRGETYETYMNQIGSVSISSPDPCIENLWKLDIIGVSPEPHTHLEQKALEHFHSTIRRQGTKYEVSLPFKGIERPPTGFKKALGQLYSLKPLMTKKPQLFNQYQEILEEYMQAGFIEPLPPTSPLEGQHHYLPHHPVFKESRTTPLRIVYNASSRADAQSRSLNDCLYTGPNLVAGLHDMILQFRSGNYAVVADISKAFLRIGIAPEHRDFTRFLWFKDNSMSTYSTFRFKVVLFGATCSPFLLNQTIRYHLTNHEDPLAVSFLNNFYVDNFMKVYDHEEELVLQQPRLSQIMADANMPLGEWASNSNLVPSTMPDDVKVLGMNWNTTNDTLSVPFPKDITLFLNSNPPHLTKRKVVSLLATVFDPLNLLAPLTIKGKLFIQTLWKEDSSWDRKLSDNHRQLFINLLKEYQGLAYITVPRHCKLNPRDKLHVFVDASKQAYGACAYVLSENGKCTLLTSKSRVAPIAKEALTVPKLELMALTIGARLINHLIEVVDGTFQECHLWGDSQVAIQWVRHGRSTAVFVENRVNQIKTIMAQHQISLRYVPTEHNPADLLTRGLSATRLATATLWFQGPTWISDLTSYPSQAHLDSPVSHITHVGGIPEPPPPPLEFFPYHLFTSFSQVLLVFRCLLAYCRRSRHGHRFNINPMLAAIRFAQHQGLFHIVKILQGTASPRETKPADHNLINQMGLYLDDKNLIRCQGRLHLALLDEDARHPLFIPKEHPIWPLLVNFFHKIHGHSNTATLIVVLRQKFWVSKMRQTVKTILRGCYYCKRIQAKPLSKPGFPPLPAIRVNYARPFAVAGVDYTGSINLKDPQVPKAYFCVFTCTTSRAVAIYVTKTLSAPEFLLTFRKFSADNGVPRMLISDNAPSFVQAAKFLQDISDNEQVRTHFQKRNIEWRFITPRAPWKGGFYERLIGIVKANLIKAIYKKNLTYEELQTYAAETQNVVNSRPLMYLQDQQDNVELTPSCLIRGRNLDLAPDLQTDPDPSYEAPPTHLKVQYLKLCESLKSFENLWRTSYLQSLRERYRHSATNKQCPLRVGDVVLVVRDNCRRHQYPLGIIEALYPGVDGVVRSVRVRTTQGSFTRAISHIIPLEVSLPNEQETILQLPNTGTKPPQVGQQPDPSNTTQTLEGPQEQDEAAPGPLRRSQRQAAHTARQRIAEWADTTD